MTAVRAGGVGDLPAVAQAMARAFYDDPVWAWMIPDASRRLAALERFFMLEASTLGLVKGTVTVPEGLAGGAICFPPGLWRVPVTTTLRHSSSFLRIFGRYAHRPMGILLKLEAKHLREPHHYVAYVGVSPDAQGRGLGTALLGPTLDRADADGLPCWLEASSPRNAVLYRRLGFEDVEDVTFAGSPPLRLMRRPAGRP